MPPKITSAVVVDLAALENDDEDIADDQFSDTLIIHDAINLVSCYTKFIHDFLYVTKDEFNLAYTESLGLMSAEQKGVGNTLAKYQSILKSALNDRNKGHRNQEFRKLLASNNKKGLSDFLSKDDNYQLCVEIVDFFHQERIQRLAKTYQHQYLLNQVYFSLNKYENFPQRKKILVNLIATIYFNETSQVQPKNLLPMFASELTGNITAFFQAVVKMINAVLESYEINLEDMPKFVLAQVETEKRQEYKVSAKPYQSKLQSFIHYLDNNNFWDLNHYAFFIHNDNRGRNEQIISDFLPHVSTLTAIVDNLASAYVALADKNSKTNAKNLAASIGRALKFEVTVHQEKEEKASAATKENIPPAMKLG